jgi:hypothetical protein
MPQTRIGGSTPQSSGDGSTPRTNTSDSYAPRDNSDGSTPRDSSDGSTPRDSSDGSTPRDTSDGMTPRDTRDGATPRTKRDTHMADTSPGAHFVPSKKLSEGEHAASARKSRLRWEAKTRNSAAEEVRVRSSKRNVGIPAGGERDTEKRSKATMRGHERNTQRLRVADASDTAILGESKPEGDHCLREDGHSFLPSDAKLFFPEPIVGPDDEFDPPMWFLEAVRNISQHKTETPLKSPVRFESGKEAADHNAELLREFGYNLGNQVKPIVLNIAITVRYVSSRCGKGEMFC